MATPFYYTYVLRSSTDNEIYIGRTSNLKNRFQKHCDGLVLSTKTRRPLELIFYEAYLNKMTPYVEKIILKQQKEKSLCVT